MKITLNFCLVLFFLSILELKGIEARHKKHSKSKKSLDKSVLNKGIWNDLVQKALNFFNIPSSTCHIFEDNTGNDINNGQLQNKYQVKFIYATRGADRITFRKSDGKYVRGLNIDVNKRTAFIVHGFQSSGETDWTKNLSEAFLQWGDVNVFVVDWSDHAKTYDYAAAARRTKLVGNEIATLIGEIIDSAPKPKNSYGFLHLLGHSLGAHVIGVAANELKKRNLKWQVQRLTGFDPAQPCFDEVSLDYRLDESDAPFVDAIHTNAKPLIKGGLGMWGRVGHLDFYPNGGKEQPGCFNEINNIRDFKKFVEGVVCNHGMSYKFFIDSLKQASNLDCNFWAFKWNQNFNDLPLKLDSESTCKSNSCIEMGINAEKYKNRENGIFFAATGKESPFCKLDIQTVKTLRSLVKAEKKVSKKHDNDIE